MGRFAVSRETSEDWARDFKGSNPAPVAFWDSVERASKDQIRTRNHGVREERTRTALWARHRAAEAALGRKLDLPESLTGQSSDERDPLERIMGAVIPTDRINAAVLGRPGVLSDEAYEARLDLLRTENTAAMAGIETRAQIASRLDAEFRAIRAEADEAARSGVAGMAGSFAGGVVGSMADPGTAGVTFATGGLGAGRALGVRVLAQGAANAGIEVLAVPDRMREAQVYGGPKYSAGEAVADVTFAAAGGAAFEVLGEGVKQGARQLRRVWPTPDRASRGAMSALEALDRDELATGGDGDALAGVRENLDRMQPPAAPEPERGLDDLFAPQPGAVAPVGDLQGGLIPTTYYGRQIWSGRFDPLAVETDAARFQYKADADGQGVTARLAGVERWDATASGKAILFEEAGGRLVVADGHQRRGLARRLAEQGWEDAKLDGYLFRETDGWTAREVRTVAALKNIREGSGTTLDAAKVFRDFPAAIKDRSLPITGEFIAQARALAKLSDDGFKAVVNKVIPERYGAAIGEAAAERPELHGDLVQLIRDGDPASIDDARALIHEGLLDDFLEHEGVQDDLFGGLPRKSTTIVRGQIRAAVLKAIRKDARMHGFLVRNADAIEAGGNALARTDNEARLAIETAAQNLVSKLALRSGPIGEAFGEMAAAVHKGDLTTARAAQTIVGRIKTAISAGERLDDLRAQTIAPEPPSAQAVAHLADFDAAAGKGQADQLRPKPEDADVEGAREPSQAVGPGDLWAQSPEALERLLADTQMSDKQKLLRALGSEDAVKEFERLDRMRNSSDPRRSDEGSRLFDEKFGELTEEQERVIYGFIDEPELSADDIRLVLKAHGDVAEADPDDWLAYMAAISAREVSVADMAAVPNGKGTPAAQAAFVRMQLVHEQMVARGIDPNSIPQRMANVLVNEAGWTPEQAAEIVGGFVDDMTSAREPGPPPGLFDDLPAIGSEERAHARLIGCAPGGGA